MSFREIFKRTDLARNTVRKYLGSEEIEPSYPRRVSSKKLVRWLEMEAIKSRKQLRNLKRIYTDNFIQAAEKFSFSWDFAHTPLFQRYLKESGAILGKSLKSIESQYLDPVAVSYISTNMLLEFGFFTIHTELKLSIFQFSVPFTSAGDST